MLVTSALKQAEAGGLWVWANLGQAILWQWFHRSYTIGTGPRISWRMGRQEKAQSWAKRRAGTSTRQYKANRWPWLLLCFLRPYGSQRVPPGPLMKQTDFKHSFSIEPGQALDLYGWTGPEHSLTRMKFQSQRWNPWPTANKTRFWLAVWKSQTTYRAINKGRIEQTVVSQSVNYVRHDQQELCTEINQHRGVHASLVKDLGQDQRNASDTTLITNKWSLCYFWICWYKR